MKRILLATDGSNFALSSAAYLADLYEGASDLEVTVLNILPSAPPFIVRSNMILWFGKIMQPGRKKEKRKPKSIQKRPLRYSGAGG
ncbi:MAG: hypothetical protein AB2L11_04465 [Syntrophobacteraceae bacterium]